MTFVDLFAGIGGFRLGLERAGAVCVGGCEIDRFARQCYLEHFGGELHGDIKTYDGVKCDLLCAGFPCQDLSRARGDLRKGLKGERSGLFFEVVRLVERLEPRWVLLENVSGLLDHGGGRDFGIVLHEMGKRGYGLAWRVFDSQYFGVPQQRRRVYLVGYSGGLCPAEILFEPEGGKGNTAKMRKKRADGAYSLTASAGGVSAKEQQQTLITGTLSTSRLADQDVPNLVAGVLPAGGGMCPDRTRMLVAPTVTAQWRKGSGGPAGDECQNLVFNTARSSCAVTTRAATVLPNDRGNGQTLWSGAGVRRLMPVECERLQGFPDNWTAMLSDTQRYTCLGNAVTVNVVEWIGRRMAV